MIPNKWSLVKILYGRQAKNLKQPDFCLVYPRKVRYLLACIALCWAESLEEGKRALTGPGFISCGNLVLGEGKRGHHQSISTIFLMNAYRSLLSKGLPHEFQGGNCNISIKSSFPWHLKDRFIFKFGKQEDYIICLKLYSVSSYSNMIHGQYHTYSQ